MATLPLIGIYNFNEHIFDGLTFPEGIDKEIAVNEILTRSGEFEILYPDDAFLTAMITHWGKKHYRTFDKWVKALAIEYKPLENFDRNEETRDETRKTSGYKTSADYTDKRTANLEDKRTANLQDKRTANLEDKRTANLNDKTTYLNDDTTSQTVDGTAQHDVAAYDSSTLVAQSKDTTNAGTSKLSHTGTVDLDTTGTDTLSHTGTDTTDTTGTDTMNHTGTDETRRAGTLSDVNGQENEAIIHKSHLYGNIGVTTSQQMLQAELDVQRFNLYENIANLFIDEFCIQVY